MTVFSLENTNGYPENSWSGGLTISAFCLKKKKVRVSFLANLLSQI